jgi:nicotinamidase/pyrazinamidase
MITKDDVLIVVDVQNDFCRGGALEVPGANEGFVAVVNDVIHQFQQVGARIVLTQDWHPANHASFAANVGVDSFEVVEGETKWPNHCVQGTTGAQFHEDLNTDAASVVIRKGMNPNIDSYSAFLENDKLTHTGLTGYLTENAYPDRVFVVGLAYDYCVGFTAVDAAYMLGCEVIVLEHATRGIGTNVDVIEDEFHETGVRVMPVEELWY